MIAPIPPISLQAILEVRREPTEIEGIELSAEYDFAGRYLLGAGYAALEGSFRYYSQAVASAATRNNRFFAGRGRTLTLREATPKEVRYYASQI